ncbi:MAG: hypothetical protein AB8I08_26370 [Sandaracinaceae bacterium]
MDPLEQKRNGYSLADCAEIMVTWTDLKTEHGEPGYTPFFQQFLRSKGLTENQWAQVWNEWHQVTETDPSLGAKFHVYMSQVQQRRLIAKQPNVSGEVLGGLSLEQYAKISAQSQTGAAVEGLVAGEGLTMEQWHAGQAAWGAKMGSVSPSDPIMLQYGQLYQKWAPNHQAMMEAATEAALSEGLENGVYVGSNLELDNADAFFDHSDIRVRAKGTRQMIHMWERTSERDARMKQLTQRAFESGLKILNEGAADRPGLMALSQPPDAVDIHTWSKHVEGEQLHEGEVSVVLDPMKDLAVADFMTPEQNESAKAAMRQAITRLEPRAAKVNALFPQVTDQLKKVQVRQLMDDYRETLGELRSALEDWEYKDPSAPKEESASDRMAAQMAQIEARRNPPETGFFAILKRLPIIGPILRMLLP